LFGLKKACFGGVRYVHDRAGKSQRRLAVARHGGVRLDGALTTVDRWAVDNSSGFAYALPEF